jgi:hypothetical protein
MKRTLITVVLFLLTATAASAQGSKGVLYQFRGQLKSASATSVALTVEGGNHRALKAMLGASVDQSFSAASSTEFLRWANGTPRVVGAGDLAAGDWVVVNVRAPRDADLADIEARAAGIVSDRGPNPNPPDLPLFLFRGKLTSVGSSSVTVDVRAGNRHGLKLLLGASGDQTFATGPETIFLLWQGKVPTVIAASQLKVGDRITVRIRAKAGSSLGEVEATAANHVGEHEPAAD